MADQEVGSKSAEEPRKRSSRISRACDECRLRKSKCNGGTPCAPCRSFERVCTYESNYGRNMNHTQRMRVLEDRLRRARAYLKELQRRIPSASHVDFDTLLGSPDEYRSPSNDSGANSANRDDEKLKLESMMHDYGRLTVRDSKTADFYGPTSGLAFLHRTRDYFHPSDDGTDLEMSDSTHSAISQLFDTPLPEKQALALDVPMSHLLPRRDTAFSLLRTVFDYAYPLYQICHQPTFMEKADRLYQLEPLEYVDSDHEYLPLFYIVTGLGFLFRQADHRKYGCAGAVSHAMRHFVAVRNMVDITQCRNIVSLQTLLCSILFLISTARLVSAHTYIGIAVASALRLGLHSRSNCDASFTGNERDMRRRLFWTVVRLDLYASSVLGLPAFMDLQAVDPTIEATVRDALKDVRESSELSHDKAVLVTATARHLQVLRIINKAIRTLFPAPATKASRQNQRSTISVSVAKLRDMEREFKDWEKDTSELMSSIDGVDAFASIKYDLEMTYFCGLIILYRPFLHVLAKTSPEEPGTTEKENTDKEQLRCAFACIKVASTAIASSELMLQRQTLYPASWPAVYTLFLSVVCLVFYIATQTPGTIASQEAQQIAETGIQILARVACHETGARRCLDILKMQMLIGHLSNAISLDIDRIITETKTLCQSDTPTPKGKEREQPISGHSENSPSRQWNPAQPSMNVLRPSYDRGSLSWQSFNQESQWYPKSQESSASEAGANQYMPGHLLGNYPFTSEGDQFASNAYSQPPYADVVEVPFAHDFAWPYETSSAGPSNQQEPGNMDIDPSQVHLSPEDIAAFMRISPTEEPFLCV